ncbi:Arginine/ornithine antiporter ArcD [hydrothermal vent metagenome]|uniref:Arginine/ornithine antiporter ArcD n=1 Tax=hydrothermal vent metagenome TaxID=652676 RepID=A0A1W1BPE7_9ZZZZ
MLFALLITLTTSIFSDNNISSKVPQNINIDSRFLLEGKKLIDPRSIKKIDEIGNELFNKTGVNVLVYAQDFYPKNFDNKGEEIAYTKKLEQGLVQEQKNSFVLFTMAVKNRHVNIIASKDIESSIDKDDILDNFVIPLLASKDKNTPYAKVSAAVLNGYAEIADSIAEDRGLKLESSIGSGNTNFTSIWRVFMYFIVISGLLVYTYAVLRAKKG